MPADQTPRARAARGEAFRLDFTLPAAGGSGRRYFEAVGGPIIDPEGFEGARSVVVVRDITERSLHRLQDRFLMMVGHELRSPLVPLQGYLEMLLKLLANEGRDERLRQYAFIARSQVHRLTGLVNDLVESSRIQQGKFVLRLEDVDLDPLLERCVKLAEPRARGQAIRWQRPEERMRVRGDPSRLEQVVMNLIQNAITHAPQSPWIDIELRRMERLAELRVRDYGEGIPARDLPMIFSSFYQASTRDRQGGGGLGLGLFIVREILVAHGGEVSVESKEGQGATFIVSLPLLEETQAR